MSESWPVFLAGWSAEKRPDIRVYHRRHTTTHDAHPPTTAHAHGHSHSSASQCVIAGDRVTQASIQTDRLTDGDRPPASSAAGSGVARQDAEEFYRFSVHCQSSAVLKKLVRVNRAPTSAAQAPISHMIHATQKKTKRQTEENLLNEKVR